eukprot:12822676-Alexandrium_andersonii.AAC.1
MPATGTCCRPATAPTSCGPQAEWARSYVKPSSNGCATRPRPPQPPWPSSTRLYATAASASLNC